MAVLEVKNVSKSFGKKSVFNKTSLSINEGDIAGILGMSGSGKSVLIKIMIGFIKPDSGSISRSGELGFSMQNNSLYENLTTMQNLKYFSKIYNVKSPSKNISEIINLLSLNGYENVLVSNLSGGTKKRVDIACALLNDPRILVLDEPFAGLDSLLVNNLIEFLKKINKKGVTIIFSSHRLQELEQLCTKAFVVRDRSAFPTSKSEIKKVYQDVS